MRLRRRTKHPTFLLWQANVGKLIVPLSFISFYAGTARDNGYFAAIVFLFGLPLFWGGVVYLFAWTVEGFLRPPAKYR